MELGEVYVKIGADTKELRAGLTQARGQVAKTSEQMRAQMKTLGTGMVIAGAAITAAFALTVKSAISFQRELAQVSTMLDESAMKIMPKYKSELLKMSAAFGESTDTLSRGLYDILSASIPPAQALEVLAVAATAATAGVTNTGVAADAITTILNSYGFSADKAGEVSDKLFAIVKRGKLTFDELAPAIGKVASMAAKTGLSFDELGAMIATLTRAGIRTDEAMTSINGVLRAFLKPTDEAKDAAAAFGLTMDTTTIKTIGLKGAMDKLRGATAEQLAQIFPNIRGLKGLIAALGDVEGYVKDYELMLNSAGLTQIAFAKQSATLGFKIDQLKKSFNVIAVTVGDVLIPVIQNIVEGVGKLVFGIKEWMDAHPGLTKVVVLLGAALGVFTMAGGLLILGALYFAKLNETMRTVIGTSKAMVPSLARLRVSINTLNGAILVASVNLIIWSEVWRAYQDVMSTAKVTTADVEAAQANLAKTQEEVAAKLGISVQEFVKMQKEGKTVTEMMDTLANRFPGYTDALNVWTMAAVEQQVNAKLIVTTVEDLTQEMSLLTKEYEASSQAISENIGYYTNMIDLLNRTDVILQTELMLLEKGTEAWYKKKEEIADNTKALNEINEALAKLTEPLEGLELIAAKMALLGDSTEDTKAKIELLNEKAVLLQQALDEAIPDTEAWWEAKIAFEGNQTAIDGLTAKLKELTQEEKEAIAQAEKLADAYKSITDKIYELTHTPMETAIRKLDQQRQAYLDLGVEIGIVNEWYDLQIAKLQDLNPELDKTTEKLKETGEVAKGAGVLGGEGWDGFTTSIKKTTVALSNFTKEGVAAAIATIKMKFFPIINDLINDINRMTGIWKAMAEANLASIRKTMNDQIKTILYGLDVYNQELKKLGGTTDDLANTTANATNSMVSSWGNVADAAEAISNSVSGTWTPGTGGGGWGITSYQRGTPYVPKTGLYKLHEGEKVTPANQNTYNNTFSPTVNLSVQGGGGPNRIAQEVENVLYDIGRQFKRRGFEIIPGRG